MMFAGALLDPDAAAYIAAVETALGSSITETQKSAIGVFAKAEKTASRWTSIKRLYLPIWGNAAANAVCLKSLASGTFVGGVTHGAGYVQGNGSTGYFDFNATIADIGATLNNHTLFALRRTSDNRSGSRQTVVTSGGKSKITEYNGSNVYRLGGATESYSGGAGVVGILVASRTTSTEQRLTIRKNSGLSQFSSSLASSVLLSGDGHYYGATPGFDYSNAQIGVAGCGLGLTAAQCDAFSLNLKTLWETCTGLTLP